MRNPHVTGSYEYLHGWQAGPRVAALASRYSQRKMFYHKKGASGPLAGGKLTQGRLAKKPNGFLMLVHLVAV